jgi:hypothetical protein
MGESSRYTETRWSHGVALGSSTLSARSKGQPERRCADFRDVIAKIREFRSTNRTPRAGYGSMCRPMHLIVNAAK